MKKAGLHNTVDNGRTADPGVTSLIPAWPHVSWRLIMIPFLWSVACFWWFKKGSYELLAKVYAQVPVNRLTHCRLIELSHIYWKLLLSILGISGYCMWIRYSYKKMVELFANSGDPDQTPDSAASGLGLHCLLITLFGVSKLAQEKWVD